jgi:hypothetical protein
MPVVRVITHRPILDLLFSPIVFMGLVLLCPPPCSIDDIRYPAHLVLGGNEVESVALLAGSVPRHHREPF